MFDSILVIAATEPAEGFLPTFGLRWEIILAQAVNFTLVAWLLWRFAFKPVMATMDARKAQIAEGLSDAEKARQQLESAEREKSQKLQEAQLSAQKIVQEARVQAEELAARQKGALEAELNEKRRRADEAITLERDRVLGEARAEVARLVVLTSGKVLQKELTEEEKARYSATAARELSTAG